MEIHKNKINFSDTYIHMHENKLLVVTAVSILLFVQMQP